MDEIGVEFRTCDRLPETATGHTATFFQLQGATFHRTLTDETAGHVRDNIRCDESPYSPKRRIYINIGVFRRRGIEKDTAVQEARWSFSPHPPDARRTCSRSRMCLE